MAPLLVLASPCSTTPSITNPLQGQKHRSHLHRLQKINLSSRSCRPILVARAIESSSASAAAAAAATGGDDPPEGNKPGAFPAQILPGSNFSLFQIPIWAKLGSGGILLLLAVRYYRGILRIEGGVEKVAEKAAELVEEAADSVGEVAKDIADVLPAGYLKEKVEKIEQIAELVEKEAEVTGAIIEKVDAITDKIEASVKERDEKEKMNKAKSEDNKADEKKQQIADQPTNDSTEATTKM